jgi:glycosyltransferase involved in cell wall biosynthesis
VSDHGRAQLTARTPRSAWDKLRLVHCGVDVQEFRASSARHEGEADDLHILTVGRLVPLKGQGVLIRAVGELHRRGVPARLTIVGDGPERDSLETLSRKAGVADHVILLGAVGQDDIRRNYAHADVFCLPSFSEGLPVVVMEAMAMELPVVATGVAGVPELVEDGHSGLLVPPARVDLLADALEELASDPERRSAMGAAGRRKILAEFRLESSARQLGLLFAGLDGSGDSARSQSQTTATVAGTNA